MQDRWITSTFYDDRRALVALQRRLHSRDAFIVQARLTRRAIVILVISSSPPTRAEAASLRDRIAKINERDDTERDDRSSIPVAGRSNRMTHT